MNLKSAEREACLGHGDILLLFFFIAISGASITSGEATPASDSPREALVAQDAAAHAGDAQADREFYQAETDQQKKLAGIIAEGDVALAKLQEAVSRQFGPELGHAVVHAAGSEDAGDAKSASEKVKGDAAMVEFRDHSPPVEMVRVEGKWKISLPEMLKDSSPEEIERLQKAIAQLTSEIHHVTELVEKHRFRSGEGVRDRIQELHDKCFGPPAQPADGQRV